MKIEKLKNYNQKLLALLGTILTMMALVALILFVSFALSEIPRWFQSSSSTTGVLSDESVEELQRENKRQQLISFQMPQLVDTLNQVYIIPVGHKTLNRPEEIDDGVLGLLNTFDGPSIKDKRFSRRYYGSFNNLLVYDLKANKTQKLFDERINFNNIRTEYLANDILVIFEAAKKDTYKDGVINLKDYKCLYVYSMNERKLKEIEIENADVRNFSLIPNSRNLMIQFGLDKNGDGHYTTGNEPAFVRMYEFSTGKLIDLVDENMTANLQKKLEGTIQ